MNTSKRYSPEIREPAVPLVRETQQDHGSQWAAIQSISAKIDCTDLVDHFSVVCAAITGPSLVPDGWLILAGCTRLSSINNRYSRII